MGLGQMRLQMRFGLAAAAVALGGCDAQVTSSYRGESMVEIRGNIVAEMSPGAARAALLWWTGGGPVAAPAITEGEFPSAFRLFVYRRPPAEALFTMGAAGEPDGPVLMAPSTATGDVACRALTGSSLAPGGGRLAIATIAAVAEDGGAVSGLAAGYALVFVASGTALSPGYHLMRVQQGGTAGVFDCGPGDLLDLGASPQGTDGTEIEIRIPSG